MAKSGKSRSRKVETPDTTEESEEAVILPEASEETTPKQLDPATDMVEAGIDASAETAEDRPDQSDETPLEAGSVDVEETTDTSQEEASPEPEPEEAVDVVPAEGSPEELTPPEPEVREQPVSTPPLPPRKEVVVQKAGFIPLLLGGAIAAGLGYLLAFYYHGQPGADYEAMIAAQSDRIAQLESELSALPTEQPDFSPISERIDEVQAAQADLLSRFDTQSGEVAGQIAAFDERLSTVERAPSEDGTLAQTAIESWERELGTLREEFAAQQAEMAALTDQAEADLAAARAEAEAVEQSAAEAAREAVTRAALSRIQAALDSGSAYDSALADLQASGAEVPPALAATAAEGAPTIIALREEFPEAARAALSAARSEGLADDGSNPLTAFLREQFEVRSVEPREGDDPDAILSRAEAALADNRLTDALAEIEALPEVARAEMSSWIERASARTEALAAADAIDQSLSN